MTGPDRVAILTGASRGIGAVIAGALAHDGHPVGLLARDAFGRRRSAAGIGSAGAWATARSLEVTEQPLARGPEPTVVT